VQGNWFISAVPTFNGTFTGTPVTDSVGGNTWVQDGTTGTTAGTGKVALFHSVLAAGGASMTVQCNYTGAVDSGVAIQNFTGNAAAGNTDGTAANGSGTSTTPNSGNVTPTQTGDVFAGQRHTTMLPPLPREQTFSKPLSQTQLRSRSLLSLNVTSKLTRRLKLRTGR
jgi:hypothetical protein